MPVHGCVCPTVWEQWVPLEPICYVRCAVAKAVSHCLSTVAAQILSQVRSHGICGGQNGTGAGFL
jgi:hypothetical protein